MFPKLTDYIQSPSFTQWIDLSSGFAQCASSEAWRESFITAVDEGLIHTVEELCKRKEIDLPEWNVRLIDGQLTCSLKKTKDPAEALKSIAPLLSKIDQYDLPIALDFFTRG